MSSPVLWRGVASYSLYHSWRASIAERTIWSLAVVRSISGGSRSIVQVDSQSTLPFHNPTMSSLKRLNKERAELANNAPDGITAAPEGDNLFKWTATINGPSGSPYEGHAFDMAVEFPAEYPFKPPKVVFTTPVYHMNVSEDGHVCLEIIQSGWGPVLTLSKVLQAVQGLLSEPNPSNPLRGELAAQFASDRAAHDAAARSFTAQKARALR